VGDRMVDLFFGPYNDTQAMYYVTRGGGDNVRRIRYIGGANDAPTAVIKVSKTVYAVNETIPFNGTASTDPDGDKLTFLWNFGDGRTSNIANPILSYKLKGTYEIKLTVTDTSGLASSVFQTILIGTPPTVSVVSPNAAGSIFQVGQIFRLKGIAKDSSGNALLDNQLTWVVRIRHLNHFHPFFPARNGNNFDLPPAPQPEDFIAANTSFLVVDLTATDSNGLSTTVRRRISPVKVKIDINTNPQGLSVLVGDFNVVAPATVIAWQNQTLKLEAVDQGANVFASWNIGGPRVRTIKVPPPSNTTNLKILARFKKL
jgi:PKD domain